MNNKTGEKEEEKNVIHVLNFYPVGETLID